MPTGHASHQVGLDADIWLTPMPNRLLTRQEREDMMAVSMLRDPLNVDLSRWTPLHTRLIKLAASYPEVERSSGDQAGSLRSSRQRQSVALESEAVVGALLSFSRAHRLSI
jgi:hypothetical protein